MLKPPETSVFPLRLAPFERYMIEDDRASHPMTIWTQVILRGQVDPAAFQAAVDEAVSRHPMFTARLTGRGNGQTWVAGPDPYVPVAWGRQGEPLTCNTGDVQRIDLTRENGVRLWMRQGEQTADMFLQSHHAPADGIGTLRFIGDVLAGYGIRTATGKARPELQPVDPARLKNRGRLHVDLPEPLSRTTIARSFLREGWRLFGCRPATLASPGHRSGPVPWDGFPHYERIELEEDAFQRLREAARRLRVSLNDLLTTTLLIALRRWNRQQGQDRPRGWLRLTMPTSMRPSQDEQSPAASMMGYAFITRRARECDDFPALLDGVSRETEAILKWGMGTMFVEGIRRLDQLPFGLHLATRGMRRFSTAVLSNVGDVSRRFTARFPREGGKLQAGNVTFEGLFGGPPVRPQTHAAFCLITYARCLTIVARTDPQTFTRGQTKQLLEAYRSTTVQLIEQV